MTRRIHQITFQREKQRLQVSILKLQEKSAVLLFSSSMYLPADVFSFFLILNLYSYLRRSKQVRKGDQPLNPTDSRHFVATIDSCTSKAIHSIVDGSI